MKKIFLLFTLLFCVVFTKAQTDKNSGALQLVSKNSEAIGLSKDQLGNLQVSSAYYNEIAGTEMVYLLQTYKGLPVYNQMLVLAFKDGKLVSNAGMFIQDMAKATNQQGSNPSVAALQAVKAAFTEAMLPSPSLSVVSSSANGSKLDFGKPSLVTENVTAELMWAPIIENGIQKSIKLAWQVQVVPLGKSDWWNIQIDAATGTVIYKGNLTVYEKLNQKADYLSLSRPQEKQEQKVDFNKLNLFNPPPPTVTSADYRVFPIPVESPNYGSQTIVHNPWELSGVGNNATTNGWHFDGTTNYSWTRGNNTFAYLDVAASNAPNSTNNWPDTSTTAIPALTFTQTQDPLQQPSVIQNKKFALNNLFYWNNLMHDVYYQYGFNEVSGNFQTDNLGRGGNGNDYVQAEAQDASGTSNANFNTPVDGTRPRMQMFLWAPKPSSTTLHVNAPGSVVGDYFALESNFSPNNLLANVGPITGDVVYFNDAGGTHEACTGAPTNTLTGKVALIIRGNCNFTVKVLAAQAAGAKAVIMVNNVAGAPIVMGGGPDGTITIPAVMISDVDGAVLEAALLAGLNVTLSGTPPSTINIDGDIDNGIVCHEFGHGISTRLTGGPGNSSCLQNAEQGGEGWSDYMSLMMITDWSTAQVTDGVNKPRAMGLYALGDQNLFGGPPGTGIRHYKYCSDITVNPLTYADLGGALIGTEVHNIGEVWAEVLWELTWRLIVDQNAINPNIFDATGNGGNSLALKLVVEGMRLQPCSPGFVNARDAILTADQNLYGGAHLCSIWAAFAKRGLGYSALQGSAFSASDQTAAFNLPPAPSLTAQPANTAVCAGTNASFSVTSTGYNLTYKWQFSTNGGGNWSDVSPAVTTATLTLTAVTGALNGYQYRCVVSGGCPNTPVNSNAGTLTVNTSTASITAQPSNTSVCVGTNAVFSITAAGTNTYNWQVSTNGGGNWNDVSPVNTTTTLTLTAVTVAMNGYQYRCVVTGGCPPAPVNSTAAILTVTTGGLSITADPSNTSVCVGGNASFTTTATGASITYNWQVSTNGGANWNDLVPPVNTATLNLVAVTSGMNNNQYRCIVNGPGACTPAGLTSAPATLTVNNAIAITTQPVNTSVCEGNDATFTIALSGGNPTYNWQVSTNGGANWNDMIPAVTTPSLTLTGVTAGMNNYQYRCQVNGDCTPALINSNAATLTINTPASITAQPANTAACVGSDATFSVTAAGAGLSYNWQVSTNGGGNWNDVSPAVTTPTLTLTGVTAAMNNYQYRCVVSIACNPTGVNSNAAVLTVNNAPAITAQPTNTAVCAGANASFCVTATGAGVTYQWQVSASGCTGPWSNVVDPTANSSCLVLNSVTSGMNNNSYQCIVSGTCTPSATTNCGVLTVNTAAAITAQPASTTGCTGGTASFSVTGSGSGLTYNWQVSTDAGATWTDLVPAVTTATLTLNNVTAGMNNNQYRCIVAGTCTAVGIISSPATLTLNSTIAITTQPVDAGVCAGTDVSFTVAANGSGLAYNWQVSTDGGTNWTDVSPANTTSSLEIIAPTVSMSGYKYRCVAAGTCNTVNSAVATLTVNTSVAITADPQDVVGCTGSAAVFTATVTGSSIAYQWQVSVGGGPFVDLTNNTPYSGVNTNTLTINPATGHNGNVYRLNASGAPCGGTISSATALLDVKALPVVVLTAASYSNITPYIRTTLYATVSPDGDYSYQWFRDGVLVPSLTTDRFAVTVDDFGHYDVVVTDLNTGCSSIKSNNVAVDYAESSELFIYPNPSSGQFQVRYYSSSSTTARTLTVYDSKGARVYSQSYTVTSPYTKMDVDLRNAAADVYLVELRDASGKRIATGKVSVNR